MYTADTTLARILAGNGDPEAYRRLLKDVPRRFSSNFRSMEGVPRLRRRLSEHVNCIPESLGIHSCRDIRSPVCDDCSELANMVAYLVSIQVAEVDSVFWRQMHIQEDEYALLEFKSSLRSWVESSRSCTTCAKILDSVKWRHMNYNDGSSTLVNITEDDTLEWGKPVLVKALYDQTFDRPIGRRVVTLTLTIDGVDGWADIEAFVHKGGPDDRVFTDAYASYSPTKDSTRECLEVIRRWYSKCIASHPACQDGEAYIPRRLIDLSLSDGTLDVKLVDCATSSMVPGQQGVRLRYATLSHRWRHQSLLKTLLANLEQHIRRIPYRSLGSTFANAVKCARYLGLRYLWIDALCIIQDSTSDWDEQSAQMGDIYSNGVVNIVAAAAEQREDEHFLCKRPRYVVIPYCITMRKNLLKGHICFDTAPEEEAEPANWNPLLQRGWIVQERLLAPRTLTFGAKTLLWECREAVFDEVDLLRPRGPRREVNFDGYTTQNQNNTLASLLSYNHQSSGEAHRNACYKYWREAVAGYTKAELTFLSDRLIALGGIAGILAPSLGDEYIAGMWSGDIARSLLWMSFGRLESGPTWSWGSYSGQIRFPLDELRSSQISQLEEHVTLCNGKPELSGTNRFGHVHSGVLELNCIVHEVLYNAIRPGLYGYSYSVSPIHHEACYAQESPMDGICAIQTLSCDAGWLHGWRDRLRRISTEQTHRLPNGQLLEDQANTSVFILPVMSWDDIVGYSPNQFGQNTKSGAGSVLACLLLIPFEHCIDTFQRLPELFFVQIKDFEWKSYPRRNIKIV